MKKKVTHIETHPRGGGRLKDMGGGDNTDINELFIDTSVLFYIFSKSGGGGALPPGPPESGAPAP